MLLLLLRIEGQRYGLEAARVLEVTPWVELAPVPQAGETVAGMFDYRGRAVPVIDLCRLVRGRTCAPCLSTRIILLSYGSDAGQQQILGLLAEQVTETVKRDVQAQQQRSQAVGAAPWLGDLIKDEEGLLQLIDIEGLLPKAMQDRLFSAA